MNKDWLAQSQKQIVNQIIDNGGGPQAGLTDGQAAAQAAIKALAELVELVETINIENADLAGLAATWGSRQLANDTGLWTRAAITDQMKFENCLARAAMALYLAADMRGMKLHLLAKARVELDAEIKERGR